MSKVTQPAFMLSLIAAMAYINCGASFAHTDYWNGVWLGLIGVGFQRLAATAIRKG